MSTPWSYHGVRLTSGPDLANISRLDHLVIPMVTRMQSRGFLIDATRLRKFRRILIGKEKRLAASVNHLADTWHVNPASGDQVAQLLFGHDLRVTGLNIPARVPRRNRKSKRLPLPSGFSIEFTDHGLHLDSGAIRRTKTGKRFKVDAKSLSLIRRSHPVVPELLEFSSIHKLRTTYTDTILSRLSSDSRLRFDIALTRVPTGRMAASHPNVLAIPVRTLLGREIRAAFIAPAGFKLVSHDLSQIELRVAAHISGDRNMIQVFHRGGDIHTATAMMIFQCGEVEADLPEHRLPAKTANFGIIFQITAEGLQQQIIASDGDPDFWTLERCEWLREQMFIAYPGLLVYVRETIRTANRHLQVWDIFGRVNTMAAIKSRISKIRSYAERIAINFRIQSSAAGIMKISMHRINERVIKPMRRRGAKIEPLLQVHDELLVECEDAAVEEYGERALVEMEQSLTALRVPVEADCAMGERWSEIK